MQDALLHCLVTKFRSIHPQFRQRAEVPENTDEKRRVLPFVDAVEFGEFDIGCNSFWFIVRVHVPLVHFGFRVERDTIEEALLAPSPPPFCDESRGAEAGMWEIVNDLVDNLLRERIHVELEVARDWKEAIPAYVRGK